ncbi:hypothetical protein BC939DRAFT_214499 [Gamsiella multidivaricata]|uniref:uncharacterized protein n=1 Tax=Gamsiella multidivaricata TaxID=101098 RepID=UPI0022203FFE|nr:uncharacterized protein BC939DRAFT_214499 [Gamsiella multidivaricata]KAG0369264.1 hypothetical protein BGZ54_010422 [Gamsiella multidivaricata]KAI7820960.1 hypothetical protein BC939DRAFT_214499 [Gamsiella multidivaricata]
MEGLYHLKQASAEAVTMARGERTRQQENVIEERRLGQLLLESAESEKPKGRTGSDLEGSTISTRYSRRRITIQQLEKQQQEVLQQVKEQRDLMAQQVALQKDVDYRKQQALRGEEREAAKKARQEQRDLEKEERLRDWEREKQRKAEAMEQERQSRRGDTDERHHKEVLDIIRQQSMTIQLLAQVILNMQQKS